MTKDLSTLYTLGYEFEQQYGNCAQCTLAAILDFFHVQEDTLFKAATPLSGGTAGMGNGNCGAYSGGALAIGLFFGRARNDFANRDARAYNGLGKSSLTTRTIPHSYGLHSISKL